jgi:acetyl esterase
MSKNTNSLVIYIEYRLIPEHKYPAALNDCFFVTKHLIKNHKKYSIDLNKVVLMGDSAGYI